MKENIDKGYPCIGNTGLTASGDAYPSLNTPNFESMGVERHQMVVYGYTLNSLGGLDEFVCHSGWHESNTDAIYSMVFTSGWSFLGNVQVTENF